MDDLSQSVIKSQHITWEDPYPEKVRAYFPKKTVGGTRIHRCTCALTYPRTYPPHKHQPNYIRTHAHTHTRPVRYRHVLVMPTLTATPQNVTYQYMQLVARDFRLCRDTTHCGYRRVPAIHAEVGLEVAGNALSGRHCVIYRRRTRTVSYVYPQMSINTFLTRSDFIRSMRPSDLSLLEPRLI